MTSQRTAAVANGRRTAALPLLPRLTRRVAEDLSIVRLARNWPQLLRSKATGAHWPEVRLRSGASLSAPEQVDLAFLFHEIWVRRTYTPPGYGIGAGHVVLDVGSNIGVFAAFAASQAAGVKVYAYEPNRHCLPWLRRNTLLPWRSTISIDTRALAGHSGTRQFRADDNWLLPALCDRDAEGGETVECVSLDEALAQQRIECCDLLKLDCEGAEYEILFEAPAATLTKIRRIVAEFHPSSRGNRAALCGYLEAHSFRVDSIIEISENEGYLCASRECPGSLANVSIG